MKPKMVEQKIYPLFCSGYRERILLSDKCEAPSKFEKELDDWLAYGMCAEKGCPLHPVDVYFPADHLKTFYVDFEDDQRDVHAAVLKRFLEESALGETRPLPFGEPVFGEPLFMTNIQREAVLVHFGTCGDWTRAVLIPSEELDDNDRVEDALDWFMHD
jgi:hypothetical protein